MAKKPIEVEDLTELRLIELGAANFKRIKAIRIRPKSALTEITGRNGQGKSSVIESFLSLFEGKAGVAAKPIRIGKNEATSYCILGKNGEPLVTISQRIWEKKGGGLSREITVEGADGTNFKTPQSIASALYAPIAFDPFEFQRMDEKAKVELIKKLVVGFDFEANAKERARLFSNRTDVGRDRDRAKAAALAIEVPESAGTEVNVDALVQELANVSEFNSTIDKRAAGRDATANERDLKLDEIERLQARVVTLLREAAELDAKINNAEPLPAKKDIAEIQTRIGLAQGANEAVQLRKQREAQDAAHDAAADSYQALTRQIEALDTAKKEAISKSKLPVDNLEFDDDGVSLNGLPFSQASSAEQLKASTLLAMATNPDLRVVIIREGSLLDDDSLEMLTAMAVERGYDLLVERVTNGEKIGVVIEDGEVAS